YITFAKINRHYLTCFRYVAHHGHKPFVLIVGPLRITFVSNNLCRINI
ncbi:MAG: hypothetical protein ACI9VI_003243, partial [Candidatus Azotimanducaceae bacterium]